MEGLRVRRLRRMYIHHVDGGNPFIPEAFKTFALFNIFPYLG
jgi:hypothetical protein